MTYNELNEKIWDFIQNLQKEAEIPNSTAILAIRIISFFNEHDCAVANIGYVPLSEREILKELGFLCTTMKYQAHATISQTVVINPKRLGNLPDYVQPYEQ